jgi:ABC-type multidrug transport system fused ATPase/permease subunit
MAIGYVFVAMARPKIALSGQRKRQHSILADIAASEAITGGREVRMSPAGEVLINEFRRDFSIYSHADADARQWQIIPRQGIEAIGVLAIVGMAMVALLSGADRIETTSMLALYAVVAVRLLPVIGDFTNAISVIQVALPNFSHLEARLRELGNRRIEKQTSDQFKGWNRIELDGAGYTYEGEDNAALQPISFTFERGLSYGFVGASGAGKSTLADVVVGLLAPTKGSERIDGVTVTDESRAVWRGRAAYVSQSPVIFDTTLADNIALGHPPGPERDARLAAAISAAGLDAVVAGLDRGADTQIGDRGVRLSGGQRQRVAIARAIFQDSDLLVLDEATSALDSLTERDVTAAIDALKGRMTMIVIAHRLSSVVQCDTILVLDQGRLSAAGSHAELMARSVIYQSFVKLQATVSEA